MSLEHRVKLVENLFLQLEKETVSFHKTSGISCVSGCGICCTYPTIEASPLEFLPWAFDLFLNGEAENTLQTITQNQDQTCFIYSPLSLHSTGRCSNYKYRGLICRLFGSAANTDKYATLRLATCKIIKEGQSEQYSSVSEAIQKGLYVPIFTDYYMKLSQIDFLLGNKIVPINKALILAIEEVLQYYAYRPLPHNDGISIAG